MGSLVEDVQRGLQVITLSSEDYGEEQRGLLFRAHYTEVVCNNPSDLLVFEKIDKVYDIGMLEIACESRKKNLLISSRLAQQEAEILRTKGYEMWIADPVFKLRECESDLRHYIYLRPISGTAGIYQVSQAHLLEPSNRFLDVERNEVREAQDPISNPLLLRLPLSSSHGNVEQQMALELRVQPSFCRERHNLFLTLLLEVFSLDVQDKNKRTPHGFGYFPDSVKILFQPLWPGGEHSVAKIIPNEKIKFKEVKTTVIKSGGWGVFKIFNIWQSESRSNETPDSTEKVELVDEVNNFHGLEWKILLVQDGSKWISYTDCCERQKQIKIVKNPFEKGTRALEDAQFKWTLPPETRGKLSFQPILKGKMQFVRSLQKPFYMPRQTPILLPILDIMID